MLVLSLYELGNFRASTWPYGVIQASTATRSLYALSEIKHQGFHVCEYRPRDRTLGRIIDKLSDFQCSDPRDWIYAVPSLCSFPKRSITPDYTKSIVGVFVDAMKVLVADSKNLDDICKSEGKKSREGERGEWCLLARETIPSWPPNLANSIYSFALPLDLYKACSEKSMELDAFCGF
jgi:hypothetical protein